MQSRWTGKYRVFTRAVAFLLIAGASRASAAISAAYMFRADAYTQTGNGNSLTYSDSFSGFYLIPRNVGDYTSAQATFAGPASPATMYAAGDSGQFIYSGNFATHAAMSAALPIGSYTYTGSNGTNSDSTSFNFPGDAYSTVLPYLAGNDYDALQGMNPALPFTFHFSQNTPTTLTTNNLLYLDIFDVSPQPPAFLSDILPASATSVTLPANTLSANRQYFYLLIFSDRLNVPSPGSDSDALIGFNQQTTGYFATGATPEPTASLGNNIRDSVAYVPCF